MSMRAVESVWQRNFLFNLGLTKERYDKAIGEATSGKKLNELSDNPADMAYVLSLRSNIQQIDQFDKNISSAKKYLGTAETALNTVQKMIQRVITLAEQGASDSNSGQPREIIADEIDKIRDSIINYGNTQVMGKYVFAGSNIDTLPFQKDPVTGAVYYYGNSENIRIQADFSIQVETNIPGDQVFAAPPAPPAVPPAQPPYDIFQRLADLSTALRADNTTAIGTSISTMHEIVDQINTAVGQLGNRSSHIIDVQNNLKQFKSSLTAKMSSLEDANMAEAITRLTQEEIGLQATLQAGARINKASLMDYLG